VLVTVVAVSVPVLGLVRLTSLLGGLTQKHTGLDAAEAVHRSAWAVEVAMRHGEVACAASPGVREPDVRRSLMNVRAALQWAITVHEGAVPTPLLALAHKYVDLAGRALDGATCTLLKELDPERLMLDEQMTDTWIDRMRELHGGLAFGERHARAVSNATAATAGALGVLAVLLSTLLAGRMGRTLKEGLAHASAAATRVGRGDFAPVQEHRGVQELTDLTHALERMRLALLETDRIKQQFLASVSHELRTPLAGLREALALLADGTAGPLTPQQERVLMLARRACEREVRVVTTLLDLSRLQSGEPLRLAPDARVDDAIRAAEAGERDAATQRNVELRVEHQGDMPPLTLDLVLVEHALANLIRNAVSVTPPGGSVVVTRVHGVEREGGPRGVSVHVRDGGPGLPEALREDPFRPFRPEKVGPDRPAGVGLGLALAREVALAHGGALRVAHTGPDGTEFVMRFPEVIAARERQQSTAEDTVPKRVS